MAGIVLLVSAGMAKYMNKNVPGIFVPDALVEEMADAPRRTSAWRRASASPAA